MDDEAVKRTVERIRAGPLSVEALLESRARSKRLPLRRPLSEAKSETRWAMEKGLYAVLDVRQSPTADIAKDFETLDKKVQKAHSAIEELLQHLDPNARKGADLELALLTAQAGIQKNSDARARHDLARDDGECLWMAREVLELAREVLERVATAAASKEVRVRRKSTAGDETRRHGIRDPSIRVLAFDHRGRAGEEPDSQKKSLPRLRHRSMGGRLWPKRKPR